MTEKLPGDKFRPPCTDFFVEQGHTAVPPGGDSSPPFTGLFGPRTFMKCDALTAKSSEMFFMKGDGMQIPPVEVLPVFSRLITTGKM
jgi:hypothetical protein